MVAFAMSSLCSTWANSVGFGSDVYFSSSGQVSIDLLYDFTNYSMYGGSVDITYDASFLEFVSFTHGPFGSDVHYPASPIGSLEAPGLYSGVGIGHLGPFGSGITSAGAIGTFVFSVIGTPTSSTPCGEALCISGYEFDPFISVMGADVTEELLANGIDSAIVVVPLPATAWFLVSGVALFRRRGSDLNRT